MRRVGIQLIWLDLPDHYIYLLIGQYVISWTSIPLKISLGKKGPAPSYLSQYHYCLPQLKGMY